MRQCSGFITAGRAIIAGSSRALASTPAIWFVIGVVPFLSLPILGQESPPSASEFDSAARISGFELRRIDQGVELWIESTTNVGLVGIEMNAPDQMVIQLPRHRAPSYLLEETFEGGPFTDLNPNVRGSSRNPRGSKRDSLSSSNVRTKFEPSTSTLTPEPGSSS